MTMKNFLTIITMIVMIMVSIIATGVAEETEDWTNGTQEEILIKMLSANWTCSEAPMFCEEEIKPIVDPTTSTVYVLAKVVLVFNTDGTIGGKFVYLPARYVQIINNNIRNIESNTNVGKEEIILNNIKYNNKDLKWTITSSKHLVIMTDNEDGSGYEYLYTYALKSFGERLYLANMYLQDNLVMIETKKN